MAMVMKPDTFSLLHVFVIVLAFTVHKPQMGLEKCWSNWPIETFPLNYSTRSVNEKEKIVQGCGPSNINCSSFVITFEVRRLSQPVPSTNFAKTLSKVEPDFWIEMVTSLHSARMHHWLRLSAHALSLECLQKVAVQK